MKRDWTSIRLVILATLVAAVCGGSITARLYYLQVQRHEHYRVVALNQREQIFTIPPRRGDIHDRNGRELALSVAAEKVVARPAQVSDPAATARLLAPILKQPAADLEHKLRADKTYVYLAKRATPDQCARIRALQEERAALEVNELAGIAFEPWRQRIYPNKELASHTLGFVRRDGNPGGGLETVFDPAIRGTDGRAVELRDARQVAFDMKTLQEASPGQDLQLTLDLTVQHVLEEELAHAARQARAQGGAAVAMDPRTGEILALASWPTFNPNNYSESRVEDRRDRVVVSAYEPGSTFKIITAAAALERGRVRPSEVIDCNHGFIMIGRHKMRDHKIFDDLTFSDIMAKSSNVGAIRVGQRLKNQEFYDTIRAFGFGEKTRVGLPGEQRGILRRPAQWSGLSRASLSIGQEITVTPLQLVAAVGAVANDGLALRPWIARSLHDPETGTIVHNTPPEPRRVISSRTARTLTRMLEGVVESGTGRAAAVPGYRVAGKTGTAQKSDPKGGGYLDGRYVASFVGYAPARNPRLIAIFVIDEPGVKAYHGGDVAAPAFGRFAARVLPGLGAAPDAGLGDSGLQQVKLRPARSGQAKWASQRTSYPVSASSRTLRRATMPDLTGASMRQAVTVLTDLGLSPVLSGQGQVLAQEPLAGAPLPTGAEGCRLWLGRR
jgi:cell division protein FtsI (penicillin-binding protein 3)